jgi:hypothetical protein
MNETASAEQIASWTKLAEEADQRRLIDVSAMDIYNIGLPKGLCFKKSHTCINDGSSHPAEASASENDGIGTALGPRHRDHSLVGVGAEDSRIPVRAFTAP